MKRIIIFVFFIFCFNNIVLSQIDSVMLINIVDISEDKSRKLEILLNQVDSKLKLILSDSNFFEINGFREIDTIINYYDRFIRVDYRFGGGSGVSEHSSKIFCVNNNRIYESFAALISYVSYTSKQKLDESYYLNYSIIKSDNYYIDAYEKSFSKEIKEDNYREKVKIVFSKNDCVFYGVKEYIDSFTECDSDSVFDKKYVYVNKLRQHKYIKYDDFWYTEGYTVSYNNCYLKM